MSRQTLTNKNHTISQSMLALKTDTSADHIPKAKITHKKKKAFGIKEDINLAQTLVNQQKMPESVKNLAKLFIDSHKNVDKSDSQKRLNELLESQTRKNEEPTLQISRQQSQHSMMQATQPQQNRSIKQSESTTPHVRHQFQKDLIGGTVPPLYEQNKELAKMGKGTHNTRSQNNLIGKVGVSGEMYKEYLPNIIKKQIDQESQHYFKPQPHGNHFNYHKNLQFQKQMQNLTGNMSLQDSQIVRQDVSYLKENLLKTIQNQSPLGNSQPTIFTTGDRAKDELIEVTLGKKNLGQSLIDLPSNLNELFEYFRGYAEQLMPKEREDVEERLVSKYMEEHFLPTEILKEQLISMSLKEFKSTFLNSQQRKSSNMINLQTTKGLNIRHQSIENLIKNNAKVPKISTKPETVAVLNPKVTKSLGKDILNIGYITKRKTRETLNNSKSQNNLKEMMSKILKNMDEEDEESEYLPKKQSISPRDKQGPSKVILQPLQHTPLGNPSSRQDALILIQWLEKMLQSLNIDLKPELKEDFQLPLIQLIFNITIQELSRQVAVHCVERGQLLRTVFHGYINLIELIYNQHSMKRKKMKVDFAQKLDKYVTVQEDQMNFYKTEMETYKDKYKKTCDELEVVKHQLNISTILNQKFKQKLYVLRKDLEGTQKKLKLISHENIELRQKIKDLSEKFDEEVSMFDEQEQMKLLERIEKDFEESKDKNVNEISNDEILKEEDVGTEMWDFKKYLVDTFGSQVADVEIQTEKLVRRNMKVGVNPAKMGILKDQGNEVEEKYFQLKEKNLKGIHQSVLVTNSGQLQLFNNESLFQKIQEDDNDDLESCTDSSNEIEVFQDEGEQQLENEWQQLMGQNKQRSYKKINGLVYQIPKRSQSVSYNMPDIRESSPRDRDGINIVINEPFQDISQVQKNFSLEERKYQIKYETQPPEPAMLIYNKNMHKSAMIKDDDVDILALDVKNTVQQLLQHEDVDKIKQETPEFYRVLVNNVQLAEQKAENIQKTSKNQSKLIKKQQHETKKKGRVLDKTKQKANQLEIDNYMLREHLTSFVELSNEQQSIADQLLSKLNKDQLGPLLSGEVKKALTLLIDKLQVSKDNKNLLQLLESKPIVMDTYKQTQIQMSVAGDGQGMNDDSQPQLVLNQYNSEELQKEQILQDDDLKGIKKQNSPNQRKHTKVDSKTEIQIMAMRKKQSTKFALFNLGRKAKSPPRKGAHPCYNLLKRIQGKNVKDLKDIMPRTMLLKIIYQVYQERSQFDLAANMNSQPVQPVQPSNLIQTALASAIQNIQASPGGPGALGAGTQQGNQQNLLEWVYDNFMQKYGFKNLADKKFNQLIQTCIIQKDYLPRIRLFGRFLEIYDEFTQSDYNKYLDMVEWFSQQVLNLKFEDDEESILIPFLEKMKKPISTDMHKLYKHLKGSGTAIDFDLYAEFVLENYIFLQNEREQLIKDVFVSIDNDNNGLMNKTEFVMIIKVMHKKETREAYKLFEEFAEPGLDEQDPDNKNISLGNFIQMALERNYFGPQMQLSYVKSNNVLQDYEKLLTKLEKVREVFKQRLVYVGLDDVKEYKDLLDNMMNNIKFPFNKRAGWLSYRILDDTLKSLYLKKQAERYMPIDLKKCGLKLQPSSKVLGIWPENYYDTLV